MAIDRRSTRLGVLATVCMLLMSALGVRLWFLQGIQAESYQRAVSSSKLRTVYVPPERGRIFDVDGRVLADNRASLTVTVEWAYIRKRSNRDELFNRLAGPLGVSVFDLQRRYDPCHEAPVVPKCTKSNPYSPLLPMPLKEDVSEEQVNQILERAEDYPGVGVTTNWKRVYPYAPLASHIVGYMGAITKETKDRYLAAGYNLNERVGQFGVELSMEGNLHGTWGEVVYEIDALGAIVREVSRRDPVAGQDIQLTIDLEFQQYAEQALETVVLARRKVPVYNPLDSKTLGRTRVYQQKLADGTMVDLPEWNNYKAPGGAVVMQDWSNGHITAMATYPTFDNRWMEAGISSTKYEEIFPRTNPDGTPIDPDRSILVNRAVQGTYNLGSSIKPFIAWSALHFGIWDRNRVFVDEGVYTLRTLDPKRCEHNGGIARCKFKNATVARTGKPALYGPLGIESALAVSSDTFFYNLGEEFFRYGDRALKDEMIRFGFGSKTGIELPYEWSGRVPDDAVKKNLIETGKFGKNEVPYLVVGDNVQVSIGQGLMAATPLQTVNAYSTLANGGLRLQPTIINAIYAPLTPDKGPALADLERGTVIESRAIPKIQDELEMPADTAEPIIRGLRRVIRGKGVNFNYYHPTTGESVFRGLPSEIDLHGKTGTAQSANKHPWNDSSAFGSFVTDPEKPISMFAYIEKGGYGSAAAAPLTKCMYYALYGRVEMDPVLISDPLDINSPLAAPPNPLKNTRCLAGGGAAVRD